MMRSARYPIFRGALVAALSSDTTGPKPATSNNASRLINIAFVTFHIPSYYTFIGYCQLDPVRSSILIIRQP
jgi:hypothetical protein